MLEETVRRAQAGDAEAFTELVRGYQDAVFGAAWQRVLDFEAARDIAQEAFVRAYERLDDLRDPAAFPGWLLRICHNLATRWQASPERRFIVDLKDDEPATDDPAERIATRDLVSRALSVLPEDNRLALTLFLVDGYSYREVARLTEAPVTTVKGRIERGRRQLAAEVLAMTEKSLKSEAPDDQFTLETARRALEEARAAAMDHNMADARTGAERVLERLPELDAGENERKEVEIEALGLVRSAEGIYTKQWTETSRKIIRRLEELGDRKRLVAYLENFSYQASPWGITESERFALQEYCFRLFEELGMCEDLRRALFFNGWHLVHNGQVETGIERWERAREIDEGLPYDDWAACLDATDELLRLNGASLDLSRRIIWNAGARVCSVHNGRLVQQRYPGYGTTSKNVSVSAWHVMNQVNWLPQSGDFAGFEESITTPSLTPHPTHTRVWIENDRETVATPAGRFSGCLLVRATTMPDERDAGLEPDERERNRRWSGEWYESLAPGVGPVESRHERPDGVTEHAVLSHFECPERRQDWIPLVEGTRWEYQETELEEDEEANIAVRLTHIAEDGTVYLPTTVVANRREG